LSYTRDRSYLTRALNPAASKSVDASKDGLTPVFSPRRPMIRGGRLYESPLLKPEVSEPIFAGRSLVFLQ